MNQRPEPSSDRTAWLAVGGVALAIICCAGPALIAGGALAALGGFFSSGSVITLGVLLVIVGLIAVRSRRSRSCPQENNAARHILDRVQN